MKKRTVILLSLVLMLSLAACGSKETTNTIEETEDSTIVENEVNTSEELVSNEKETEETTVNESAEAPVEESISEPTETTTQESTPEPTETPEPYTYTELDQVMYAKQTVNVRSIPSVDGEKLGGLNLNDEVHVTGQCVETSWYRIEYNGGIGYVSNNYLVNEKVEESANNPENSTNNSTSNDGTGSTYTGNGDELAYTGSLTLPSSLEIKTLNMFNNAGMSVESGNSWMGDIYSDIVAKNYTTMADNFDAFNQTYTSVINVTNGEQIWWRSSMANSGAAIEIRRCGDHYKLIISSPLLDDATAESLGWMSGRQAEAREALTVLLSTISSTPQSLSDAIVDSIYNTNSPVGQEPIKADGNWAYIGDCRIRVGAYDFENGNHMVVFRIK